MAHVKSSTSETLGTRQKRSSLRNFVGWRFEQSENVLCFEPDGHKAHVLYEAQILQRTMGTDSLKRNWPEYHVHFLRWSSTWDRVVPESFLLPKCEENEALKKAVRRLINSGSSKAALRQRNQMLEEVLSACLDLPPLYCGYQYYPYGPEKLASRSLICDVNALENFMNEHQPDSDNQSETRDFNASFMVFDTPLASKSGYSLSDRFDLTPRSTPDRTFPRHGLDKKSHPASEISQKDDLSIPDVPTVSPQPEIDVVLKLPGNLKNLLDVDWTYVVRDGNLHSLPASPSVSEILSQFSSEQNATGFPQSELKSVADSIEALFNVICSDLLLYINRNCNESTQYCQYVKNNNLSSSPSGVYGAWHLLRFFVRFPDLLARLPDVENIDAIVEICNFLLTFLNDHRQQLFSLSARDNNSLPLPNSVNEPTNYDNNDQTLISSSGSSRKRRKF